MLLLLWCVGWEAGWVGEWMRHPPGNTDTRVCDPPLPPRPTPGRGDDKEPGLLSKAAHAVAQATPGTKAHQNEYGTKWTMGGPYRLSQR